MTLDRVTLERWLLELTAADALLAPTDESIQTDDRRRPLRVVVAQRHIWFVVGQLRGVLVETTDHEPQVELD